MEKLSKLLISLGLASAGAVTLLTDVVSPKLNLVDIVQQEKSVTAPEKTVKERLAELYEGEKDYIFARELLTEAGKLDARFGHVVKDVPLKIEHHGLGYGDFPRRLIVHKSRAEGELDLMSLAEHAKVEDAWLYLQANGEGYWLNFGDKEEPEQVRIVAYRRGFQYLLEKLNLEAKDIEVLADYHIHPGKQPPKKDFVSCFRDGESLIWSSAPSRKDLANYALHCFDVHDYKIVPSYSAVVSSDRVYRHRGVFEELMNNKGKEEVKDIMKIIDDLFSSNVWGSEPSSVSPAEANTAYLERIMRRDLKRKQERKGFSRKKYF